MTPPALPLFCVLRSANLDRRAWRLFPRGLSVIANLQVAKQTIVQLTPVYIF
jgi:hypothetical protein